MADGQLQAAFRYKAPKAGRSELRMAYPGRETRAKYVPVAAISGDHEKRITVDQAQPLPAGRLFKPVGIVHLGGDASTRGRLGHLPDSEPDHE